MYVTPEQIQSTSKANVDALLSEAPSAMQLLGVVAIVAGLVLATVRPRRAAQLVEPEIG